MSVKLGVVPACLYMSNSPMMFLSNRGSFRPETSGAYTLRRRGRRQPKSGSAIGACAVARLAGSGGPIGDYYGSANKEGSRNWGYRTMWARLRREGTRVSEKVVRRLMREEGLEVAYNRRRRRWSSYAGEASAAPPNLVARDFSASAPDELWVTDITEFRIPAGKCYLSAVVDCFDGRPAGWRIGPSPTASLANGSLADAVAARRGGARTVVHSDRGGHYRWPGWIAMCEEAGLVRSMSAKGCSPDNAACEGFFGRLKNEFFHYRDWEGVSLGEFAERLDSYLLYYRSGRIKRSLGWLSPDEYRASLGYAA